VPCLRRAVQFATNIGHTHCIQHAPRISELETAGHIGAICRLMGHLGLDCELRSYWRKPCSTSRRSHKHHFALAEIFTSSAAISDPRDSVLGQAIPRREVVEFCGGKKTASGQRGNWRLLARPRHL